MHSDSKTLETGCEWVQKATELQGAASERESTISPSLELVKYSSGLAFGYRGLGAKAPSCLLTLFNECSINFLSPPVPQTFPSVLVPCLAVEFRQPALVSALISTYQVEYLLPNPDSSQANFLNSNTEHPVIVTLLRPVSSTSPSHRNQLISLAMMSLLLWDDISISKQRDTGTQES